MEHRYSSQLKDFLLTIEENTRQTRDAVDSLTINWFKL